MNKQHERLILDFIAIIIFCVICNYMFYMKLAVSVRAESTISSEETVDDNEPIVVYFEKPHDWNGSVNCYVYEDNMINCEWPGDTMVFDNETGYYKYEVSDKFDKPFVIFNDGKNQLPLFNSDIKFVLNGKMIYKEGEWKKYSIEKKGTVNVEYIDELGNILDKELITGVIGESYTTFVKNIDGYTLKEKPNNEKGEFLEGEITVKYIYSENIYPKVIATINESELFESETANLILELKNASSGTYSIDNGPVIEFSESVSVVIGKGKIADSEIIVDVTATDGEITNVQRFVYNKKFVNTIDEENNIGDISDEDVSQDILKLNFGIEKSSPQCAGTTLKLIGDARGGHGEYTYKYYVNNSLIGIKINNSSTYVTWTPFAKGSYLVKCIVSDEDGEKVLSSKYYDIEGSDAVKNGWMQSGSIWFYYVNDVIVTGWKQIEGKWFYFNPNGIMQTGWQEIKGEWYYFDYLGVMQKGWKKINNKWYYFSRNGVMQKGWQKIGTKWYYFNSEGEMQKGWQKIGAKWYYFNSSGEMLLGWQKISNKWYYFDGKGIMQSSKWIQNIYYVKSNGVMATSEWVCNGKYYVDQNGKYVAEFTK